MLLLVLRASILLCGLGSGVGATAQPTLSGAGHGVDTATQYAQARCLLAVLLLAYLAVVLCRSHVIFGMAGCTISVILVMNYGSREWLEQPFEVHYFFGTALSFAARHILAGDGRPATSHWLTGSTLTLVSGAIFYGDWTHTTYLAHLILDSSGVVIGLMSVIQSTLGARSPRAAARVRRVREMTDPACLAAVGFVFLKHIHYEALAHPMPAGQQSITNLYHSSIAWSMLVNAATQLASTFVHTAMGYEMRESDVCRLTRRVAAFAMMYPGLVLVHMACVLHVRAFPDGSNFHTRWGGVGLYHANEEAMCLYLAQLVLADALIVAILTTLTEKAESAARTASDTTREDDAVTPVAGKTDELKSLVNNA